MSTLKLRFCRSPWALQQWLDHVSDRSDPTDYEWPRAVHDVTHAADPSRLEVVHLSSERKSMWGRNCLSYVIADLGSYQTFALVSKMPHLRYGDWITE